MIENEILRQAILKILTRKELSLFGCIVYKFDIKITNDPRVKTAACTIDRTNRKPVIAFDETFLKEHILNVNQAIFVVLHEILHFVDGHLSPLRFTNKHQWTFNMACDHIINTMLIKDSSLSTVIDAPNGVFTVPEFKNKKPTLNEVYLWLMENRDYYTVSYNNETGMIDVFKHNKHVGSFSPDLTEDELDDEISAELKSDIRNQLSKMKGNSSSDLYKYLQELVEVKLPWETILENEIAKTRVKSSCNKSWRNLRKKLYHLSLTLPSHSTDEKNDSLYIARDTSGSLWDDDTEQNKFINLIFQATKFFKTIKVIQHDVKITNILEIDSNNFESTKSKIFDMYGGGGTSHTDVFEYIEDQYFNENEEIGLIILATDYLSDVESIWNSFEFHNYVPLKVLCVGKTMISPNVDPNPIFV